MNEAQKTLAVMKDLEMRNDVEVDFTVAYYNENINEIRYRIPYAKLDEARKWKLKHAKSGCIIKRTLITKEEIVE